MKIDVAFLPSLPVRREQSVAVVVDVLRATSSIAVLLDRGVPCVYPAASPDEAAALCRTLGTALACGEEQGLPPDGFAYGNSPSEFASIDLPEPPPPVVLGTTNGTAALLAAASSPVAYAASLLNGGAVVRAALAAAKAAQLDIALICAGTEAGSRFCLEDAYTAGALVARLALEAERAGIDTEQTDAAQAAVLIGRSFGWKAGQALRQSSWGQSLIAAGLEQDVVFCAQQDRCNVAPRLVVDAGPPRLVAEERPD